MVDTGVALDGHTTRGWTWGWGVAAIPDTYFLYAPSCVVLRATCPCRPGTSGRMPHRNGPPVEGAAGSALFRAT